VQTPRYSSGPLERVDQGPVRRLVLPRTSTDTFDSSISFILFDPGTSRLGPPLISDVVPSFRDLDVSFTAEFKHQQGEIDDALGDLPTTDDDIRRQTVELEQYLRDHRDNVDAWIKLSTLHVQVDPSAPTPYSSSPQATTRAAAEVSMSILDRALNAHPRNMASVVLHLAHFRAAEVVWPAARLRERWRNVLLQLVEDHRTVGKGVQDEDLLDFWMAYLNWSEGPGFSAHGDREEVHGVDRVLETYVECLRSTTNTINSGRYHAYFYGFSLRYPHAPYVLQAPLTSQG
jgi:hypothetical protein